MPQKYDVAIIGSGLGGLFSALILAKEGKKVAVIEKNSQFGGNLQTFSRNSILFDTGVHYLGGLAKGQALYEYFSYAGIASRLDLERMPINGYDYVTFGKEPIYYPHAQGGENFIRQLLPFFPREEVALSRYIIRLQELCDSFPLYRFRNGIGYDMHTLSLNLKEYLNEITSDTLLQSVLVGNNFLYGGATSHTPLYLHALSVSSYMESAWRLKKGGSQITHLLLEQLQALGVTLFREHQALAFEIREEHIYSVITSQYKKIVATDFISDIDIKQLLQIVGKEHFKPSYYKRIEALTPTRGVFSLHLVLKPESIPYQPYNLYWFKSSEQVWRDAEISEENFTSYMLSMNPPKKGIYTDNMTIMAYMDYNQVREWENTFNTVGEPEERSQDYTHFKNKKAQELISLLYQRYPQLKGNILAMYTATPLTYRDYIGNPTGAVYGYQKSSDKVAHTRIMPQTHIPNLYLTGQSVNMHGLLGVVIGAVVTCSTLLRRKIKDIG